MARKHRQYAIFATQNPDTGKAEFFEANALPFGASAAVHGFHRAAMALEHLLHETMGVPSTHYFDDFTLLAPMGLGETLSDIAKEFLDLLGWDIKKSKGNPMNQKFVALGGSNST